jgi:hypothetical protein
MTLLPRELCVCSAGLPGLIGDVSGRGSSIAIILGGSVYYTWVKHQENQPSQTSTTKNGQHYDRLQMEDVESGKLSRTSSYSGKPE